MSKTSERSTMEGGSSVESLYKSKCYNDAIKMFESGGGIKGSIATYYYAGMSYYAVHKYMKASTQFGFVIQNLSGDLTAIDNDPMVENSYFYKGNCMYSLKKYRSAADECFGKIPATSKFFMSAKRLQGNCYEELGQYRQAEDCFKRIKQIWEEKESKTDYSSASNNSYYLNASGNYHSAKRELIKILIKQDKADSLILLSKNIDDLDDYGNSLLMYAVIYENPDLVKKLIVQHGANPFKVNGKVESAISMAIDTHSATILTALLEKAGLVGKEDEGGQGFGELVESFKKAVHDSGHSLNNQDIDDLSKLLESVNIVGENDE
jgi:tetratricopeptide (TPR) repeat protein